MFRHVVMWNYTEGLSAEENKANALKIKEALEGLKQHIPEVLDIKVVINEHPNSNKDILLDSTFKDEEGFKVYKAHPEHLKAAEITRAALQDRVCVDWVC